MHQRQLVVENEFELTKIKYAEIKQDLDVSIRNLVFAEVFDYLLKF